MTKRIMAGSVPIGGGAPVSIQSMLKADIRNIGEIRSQLAALEEAGCDIVRAAVPDADAADALAELKKMTGMSVVADIHFDWRLAVRAARAGADKIRINPGNIGSREGVRAVAKCCLERGIPIRIGVNSGSLEKGVLEECGNDLAEAMVRSALRQAELLESCGFGDICVSLKASDAPETIRANRLLSARCDYPIHIGVTESGNVEYGTIKSAVGIGSLLCDGIGDTVRVSLTAEPWREVVAAKNILRAAGIRRGGVEIISCPTCGRTKIDLMALAREVEEGVRDIKKDLKVAVMGCVVNGPGEASNADYGIAGGSDSGVIFAKGRIIEKLPQSQLAKKLISMIRDDNG